MFIGVSLQAAEAVTKFEVMPTDRLIPAGHIDEQTKLPYLVTVKPQMRAVVSLRSNVEQAKSDLVIQWGDGTSTTVASSKPPKTATPASDCVSYTLYEEGNPPEYWVDVYHTYKKPGRYIVEIHGTKYFALGNNGAESLMSRVFDKDLPIAQHVTNICSWAAGAPRLQAVDIPKDYALPEVDNATSLFRGNVNLLYATGLRKRFKGSRVFRMFHGCCNLLRTDLKFTPEMTNISDTFNGCEKLFLNVRSTMPKKFFNGDVNMTGCFTGCKALYNIPQELQKQTVEESQLSKGDKKKQEPKSPAADVKDLSDRIRNLNQPDL